MRVDGDNWLLVPVFTSFVWERGRNLNLVFLVEEAVQDWMELDGLRGRHLAGVLNELTRHRVTVYLF